MIILIGSQKGGCGKSTLAINLSTILVNHGRDIVLVDADRQGTASRWAQDRIADVSLTKVNCIQKFENIRETLLDLNQRYEIVLVDTAGRDSRELRTGMTVADILLIPFRPSQADLDTLVNLKDVIQQARDINPKLKVMGLLTMTPTNPQVNEAEEAIEYLKDYPEISLLSTVICDRKIYRDSISEGKGIIEMNNEKAKSEIKQLIQEII